MEYQDAEGHWTAGHIEDARQRLCLMAEAQTEREGLGQRVHKTLWLVEVRLLGTNHQLGTVVAYHRLASNRRQKRRAHLPHVSPTLGRRR